MLVLEEREAAVARNAPILAELSGYGMTGDGHHITAPSGDGAERAMRMALEDADLLPSDVGHVNAHATSTPVGDMVELAAIDRVFGGDAGSPGGRGWGQPVLVSSTKGATGHMLGAAGAIEAAFSVFSLLDGKVPPTLNLTSPSDPGRYIGSEAVVPRATADKPINSTPAAFQHVPQVAKCVPGLRHVLSNSFGFGGTNACLVFSKYCT